MMSLQIIAVRIHELPIDHYIGILSVEECILIRDTVDQRAKLEKFTACILKRIFLAKVLNVHPSELVIETTQFGRPFLKGNRINFNISHSKDYVVMVVSDKYTVGIDIQHIKPTIKLGASRPLLFSDKEWQLVNNSARNFYLLWVKKESLLKAIGFGLLLRHSNNISLTNYQLITDYNTSIFVTKFLSDYFLALSVMGS